MSGRIVIIGAGQAGCQLAISLRERKFDGSITLVTREPGAPYQKPLLSKAFLLGKVEDTDLDLRPLSYFEQKRITVMAGVEASAIDRSRRSVQLAGGGELPYDHLVLATGSENRQLAVPGNQLDGVLSLRTRLDAARLRRCLSGVRRLVVVGAGFIGLEVAAVASELGLEVDVVAPEARPLTRALSAPVGTWLKGYHEAAGVRFHLTTGVDRFGGQDGRLRAVKLSDGRVLPADLALVAIGVVPETALAVASGLTVTDGIVVDAALATADPAIHAIGDAANLPHALFDHERLRIESIQNATDQARCLAATLTGSSTPYRRLPWFWSDQGGIRLQIAGIGREGDDPVQRGDPAAGRFSVFRLRAGRLVAVESVNQPGEHMVARTLVEARLHPDPAELRDPAVPLKQLLAVSATS